MNPHSYSTRRNPPLPYSLPFRYNFQHGETYEFLAVGCLSFANATGLELFVTKVNESYECPKHRQVLAAGCLSPGQPLMANQKLAMPAVGNPLIATVKCN
ncbi:MAG: hypothetical protein MUC60_13365 [Oscillatoria sp. Prado101]|nr:hypothetical protein [Oscillatoria sp. Prado101]